MLHFSLKQLALTMSLDQKIGHGSVLAGAHWTKEAIYFNEPQPCDKRLNYSFVF